MQVEHVAVSETPEEICGRVFHLLKPRTPVPAVRLTFCKFANANSFIRLIDGRMELRVSDILTDAPLPVMEALAFMLIAKLYRRTVPDMYKHRYRTYLNRKDVRARLHHIRRDRGRKLMTSAQGKCFNLVEVFENLNLRFFHGLMARPDLGWTMRSSRSILGHYDLSHHAIVLSKNLDKPHVSKLAVEYVMFHEMLHLQYPAEHRGSRRCVHTPEFKKAEKEFPDLAEAKRLLKHL